MDSNLLERIRIDAIETCATTGIMVKKNTDKGHPEYIHAPISLFPLVYPADLLQKALEMQPDLGKLVGSIIANPQQNIYSLLENFSVHDFFMSKLIEICGKFNALKTKQDIHMCILRSDYMID